ncbi:hypothetical protein PHACT_02565 [Pseudohongiella acticola]|jgi:hypothetical protein|uniref:Uncharacterized protein n=1 Tax=Pseudohongiella acticola TaxID=1524254 RepID=A0A1E8CIH0_9GAMM|nr:hypothetical protein [Pseudohongiella acticola]OFE12152.1 hypothetical protein PHACT_02565 [Pseudohongiella acticola]
MESKAEKKQRRRRGNIGIAIGVGLSTGLGFGLVMTSVVYGVAVGGFVAIALWAAGVGARKEVARQEGN